MALHRIEAAWSFVLKSTESGLTSLQAQRDAVCGKNSKISLQEFEQADFQSKADAAGEMGTDEEYVAHLVSLIMTRAVAQAEGGPQ